MYCILTGMTLCQSWTQTETLTFRSCFVKTLQYQQHQKLVTVAWKHMARTISTLLYLPAHKYGCTQTMVTNQTVGS